MLNVKCPGIVATRGRMWMWMEGFGRHYNNTTTTFIT